MASYHDLRIGETLALQGAGRVRVTLRAKSGRLARLEITADEGMCILPIPGQDEPVDPPAIGHAETGEGDRFGPRRLTRALAGA
jgi:hypothetical protein